MAVLVTVAATGCGEDVPEGAIAKVGETPIERTTFDHWLNAAARSQTPPGAGGAPVVPDPPEYTECVAALEAQQPPPQGGGAPPTPSPAELKDQCEQQYNALKDQVVQFLTQAEAIEQEAEARSITLPQAEVTQQYEDLKQESFPKEEEFQQFLETSGRTEEDLLFQVRLDLLSNRIREEVVAEEAEPTPAEIETYYNENKNQPPIGEPETRDLELVLTEDEADAEEALERLEKGESFAKVADDLSIDDASRSRGGKLEGVREGQQEMALDEAVFGAEEGELAGPVETEFGFYVFEVTKVNPPEEQTLEDASGQITDVLRTQEEQQVLESFVEDFTNKYTELTSCAEGFVTQGCKGAPEQEQATAAPGAPPGGVPQGGAPQGAPPGAPQQGVGPGGNPGVPPQGAPPQGVPPQGVPPQGAPPQGGPPQGGGQQDVPPGSPPQGIPPQGGGPGG